MLRKFFLICLLAILFALTTGCAAKPANPKLFTSKTPATITLDEQMPLYKTMDIHGAIIGIAPAGEYKVIDAVGAEDDQGTWIKIEVKGVKGYILAVVVKVK